jgi:ribonuclease P protein subunit RPR2
MNVKIKKRIIAKKRAKQLLEYAIYNSKNDVRLSIVQANIIKNLCTKFNVRLDFSERMLFCHKCKRFIVPGFNSRIRLSKIRKSINITCLFCGYSYRKMIGNSQT